MLLTKLKQNEKKKELIIKKKKRNYDIFNKPLLKVAHKKMQQFILKQKVKYLYKSLQDKY